jgi:putative drug exporter of the RND superfamily
MFLSPDGKAARFIITHDGDPAPPEGISHVDAINAAVRHAVKGNTPGGRQGLPRRHRADV